MKLLRAELAIIGIEAKIGRRWHALQSMMRYAIYLKYSGPIQATVELQYDYANSRCWYAEG
jgi:hypothetical protein